MTLLMLTFHVLAHAQQKELQNLTSTLYQKEFNKLVAQGYRPIKVWSKTLQVIDYDPGEVPRPGYWAIFEKRTNSSPWVARHGLSASAYQTEFNTWTSKGFIPSDINVACVEGHVIYCVIYDKYPTPMIWQARHGLDYATYNTVNKDLLKQGYKRRIFSFCKTPGGNIFAAMWAK
ncbi:hypothetical protein DVR12_14685 [Chitinophaga silvatica]|uniref:Uncharacterized protein n=2 Tax=Chitinophaga silvatica TaxID=2282649 RepID=A0A3E1Y916_9BACT|nr:hypothetical protein DVR12_14685 [Chitinophaga silvatica]